MIRTLRAYFLSRALREKLLLVIFIAIGLLWWLSAYTTRASGFWRQQKTTTAQLADQAQWIKNQPAIEQSAQRAAGRLEASKTLNANLLATTVQQIATDTGVAKNFQSTGAAQTTPGTQFAIHTASFIVRNADWDSIQKFHAALQQKAPYIAVDQFNLSAGNNPSQLTLLLRVESVEIVR